MELTNEFRVGVPVDRAWEVLTDVELIAPCLPGAQLTEIDGETYHGQVKVKVGPITAQYKGSAHFIEKDDVNHKAVLDGTGRDTRGQGNASAIITAQLTPDGDGTKVDVTTELKVTGKVAQFGRGVLADVSAKLLDQFVDCLVVRSSPDRHARGRARRPARHRRGAGRQARSAPGTRRPRAALPAAPPPLLSAEHACRRPPRTASGWPSCSVGPRWGPSTSSSGRRPVTRS